MRISLNSIRTRIAVGTGALVVVLVVVALIGIAALRTVQETVGRELASLTRLSDESNALVAVLFEQMRAAEQYLNEGSPATRSTFQTAGDSARETQRRLETLSELTPGDRETIQRMAELQAEVEASYGQAHAQRDLGRQDEAHASAVAAREIAADLVRLVRRFSSAQGARAHTAARALAQTAADRMLLVWAVLLASLFVGSAIGMATLRSVERPLTRLAAAAKRFGDGDLRSVYLGSLPEELAGLGSAMGKLGATVRSLLSDVASAGERVATTAEGLSAASRQVTARTGDNAPAIADMRDSAGRQVESLEKSAAAAKHLHAAAEEAGRASSRVAERGVDIRRLAETYGRDVAAARNSLMVLGEVVQKAARQVDELDRLSASIYDFIDLIKRISSQTNLLALNAAIEAARAGERGVGFSVVAEEVRHLADSSARAAEEVSGTIKTIRDHVTAMASTMAGGRAQVRGVGSVSEGAALALEQIVAAIREIESEAHHVAAEAAANLEAVDEMRAALHSATRAAQGHASSSQNVAAAAEQQGASTRDMTARAEELTSVAERLRSLARTLRT